MKNTIKFYFLLFIVVAVTACKKSELTDLEGDITASEKLRSLGFDLSQGFHIIEGGYIVENDIHFTESDIDYHYDKMTLTGNGRIAIEDLNTRVAPHGKLSPVRSSDFKESKGLVSHYRTTNLVNVPFVSNEYTRTVKIYIPTSLGTALQSALNSAINRYNALDLSLNFQRTMNINDAHIKVSGRSGQVYLMSAGFPVNGMPYPEIFVNTDYYNDNSFRADIVSTLAHEIGHCIGLRHTDYMNRTFSCGTGASEGAGAEGAIHIPGTPTAPESKSFMLACSDNTDRPFTNGDVLALKTLYYKGRVFYVKLVKQIVADRSHMSYCCATTDRDINYSVSFYKDASCTIPHYAEFPFVLRGRLWHNNNFVARDVNITVNQHTHNYGTFNYFQQDEWGEVVNEDIYAVELQPNYPYVVK